METTTILLITTLTGLGVTVLGKILYSLRTNIKSCYGITFRSVNNTPPKSPPELNMIRQHFQQTITPQQAFNNPVSPQQINNEMINRMIDEKLKNINDDRVYI